jgi:hypothetical protein
MLTLKSRDFGAWTNGIRISVVAGTADAALPIAHGPVVNYAPKTLVVEHAATKKLYQYVVRVGLLIHCQTGTATLSLSRTEETFTLVSGAVTESVSFEQAPTLKDLADWLASHGVVAKVIGSSWYPSDILSDAGLSAVATDLFWPGEEAALHYIINSKCPLVYSESPLTTPGPIVASAAAFLTGGTGRGTDVLEATGLARALAIAETTTAHLVFLQSTSEALQQLTLAHCQEMNTVEKRRYRIFIAGINFSDSSPQDGGSATDAATLDAAIAAAIDRAHALDGPSVLCFDGTVAQNPTTGRPEQLGGLGLAAQVIGLASGSTVATPLTNKPVVAQALEFPALTQSQEEALLDGGVLFPRYDEEEGRTKIVQAITCFQTTNPMFRNLQGLRIQHQIERMWIRVLSGYIGAPLDLDTGERIKADCAVALDDSKLSGSNPYGFLTEGKKDGRLIPAWDSLSVIGDSTVGSWEISVNAHPVGETDFIVVRTKLTPAPIEL